MAEDDSPQPAGRTSLIGASPRTILAFAARTIAWCVPLFALWYFAAQPVSLAASWGAAKLLAFTAPVENTHATWRDDRVTFELSPDATTQFARHLKPGLAFEVPVDVRKQTYGLPFFLALLLAGGLRRMAVKALVGCAVLLALSSIGIACEVAVAYAGIALPGGGSLFSPGQADATLIALGYQLGTIIFPSVMPVALWTGLEALPRSG
jgi:hypothetical protein